MAMRLFGLILSLVIFPIYLTGQPVAAPAFLGYLQNVPTGKPAAAYGVPGAAHAVRSGLVLPDAEPVWLPPGQGYVLARTPDGLVSVVNGERRATLAGLPAASGEQILFSPTGSWAAFYDAATATARLVSGLPGQPVDRGVRPAGERPLAISDSGELLLATPGMTAAAFMPGSEQAAACDRESGALFLLERANGGWSRIALASALASPEAVAVTADGRRVLAASRAESRVQWIELQSGLTGVVECPVPPERLERMRDASVFAIGGLWMVDASENGKVFPALLAEGTR